MIRKAVPEDADIVYQLISDLEECEFPESEFRQIFDEILISSHHCIFLYENNSEVMGLLHLRLENQLHHCGKTAEIMELIIKDGHRSEGIGGSLFNAASEYAVKQKCVIFEVTSKACSLKHRQVLKQNLKAQTHSLTCLRRKSTRKRQISLKETVTISFQWKLTQAQTRL